MAVAFDWDEGNCAKCQKHGLTVDKIEDVFAASLIVLPDDAHSSGEKRYRAVGKTSEGRYVFLVFTIRHRNGQDSIRPISARYMHRKEIANYEEKENSDL
jgi:uncharacterized DUF497 family protein